MRLRAHGESLSPSELWQEVVMDEAAVESLQLLDWREILGLGVEIRLLQGLQEGQQSPVLLARQVRVAAAPSSRRVPGVEGVKADHVDGFRRQSLARHGLSGILELLDVARMAFQNQCKVLVMAEGHQDLIEAAIWLVHSILPLKRPALRIRIHSIEALLGEDVARVKVAAQHKGVPHPRPLGHGSKTLLHADLPQVVDEAYQREPGPVRDVREMAA
mmetsp:Transcript_5836/g.13039  ORF Transcript_5836/g.13039 Transcript_5836/m.13039 type:complete len:217 (-) Transcript_5836:579-1229(-)